MNEIKCLHLEAFQSMQDEWQHLLQKSTANPLFMSWYWHNSWWEIWGNKVSGELRVIAVYQNDKLIAIMPMYRSQARLRLFNIYRLQYVGNHWNQTGTVRSEYLQPIVQKGCEDIATQLLSEYLSDSKDWHELVLCDVRSDDTVTSKLLQKLECNGIVTLRENHEHGYCVDTTKSYEEYLSRLGAKTRLRLHNRRGCIKKNNLDLNYSVCEDEESITYRNNFFSILNQFHSVRWGKPCFDDSSVKFHLLLLSKFSVDPMYAGKMSYLVSGGRPVSILYNIQAGESIYNLQSGFVEEWHKKVALGTIHIGYALESACSNTVNKFDFLVGKGKNSDYKSRLGGDRVDVSTVVLSSNLILQYFYRIYYWLPKKVRKIF